MGQVVVNWAYRHYLTTLEWRARRSARLEIDDHKCVRCGGEDQLQVHHVDYAHVFEEDPERDLETLCRACHMREHDKDPTLPKEAPKSFYRALWQSRQDLLRAQEEIAEAAGIDISEGYPDPEGYR